MDVGPDKEKAAWDTFSLQTWKAFCPAIKQVTSEHQGQSPNRKLQEPVL